MNRRLSVIVLLLALAGCSDATPPAAVDTAGPASPAPPAYSPPTEDTIPMTQPLPTPASVLAWRLHAELVGSADNSVYSPLSIAAVLGMLAAGAEGQTLAEIDALLDGAGGSPDWHRRFGAELAALLQLDGRGDTQLRLGNDLWLQDGFVVGREFTALLESAYSAAPRALDFAGDPDAARGVVNARVDELTAGLIPELLPPGSVDRLTRLVLANALYLKAAWQTPFFEGATEPGRFTRLDGSEIEVPMMLALSYFEYADSTHGQLLRLPYADGRLEMLLLLPAPGNFARAEATLDARALDATLATSSPRRIELRMPKMTLRQRLPLASLLQQLDLQRVFTAQAELGRIGPELFVSAALHEAVIAIDERGTEAAAATAAVIGLTSAPVDEPLPVHLDRPFLLWIRERDSGLPLFQARVVDPLGD